MSFASPLWLVFLIPWLGLVLWLLAGARDRVAVPFLELWSAPAGAAKVHRTIQPPPVALACALAAILFGVLGAAMPMIHRHRLAAGMTLIVDRGVTMSAGSAGQTRFEAAIRWLPAIEPARVALVPPWSGLLQDGSNWKDAGPSAVATGQMLRSTVAEALNATDAAMVVVSDQALDLEDSRVIQISPPSMPENLDIVRVAASTSPTTQLMVRVRNQSSMNIATVATTTAGQTLNKSIDLPPRDQEKNVFVDLPAVGDVIEVRLSPADDLAADNVAWLVRQRSWPKVEVRAGISAELRRMIEVYQAHRASGEGSRPIAVVDGRGVVGENESGVIVTEGTDAAPPSGRESARTVDHPVARGVHWSSIGDASAGQGPGEGWSAVVSMGDRVLVAVRDVPARQVWVGFESASFPTRPDFVIFWTNVLDWVGQGGDEFVSEPVGSIGGEWKIQTPAIDRFDISPGVYRRSDGMLRAMNAGDVRFSPRSNDDGRSRLSALIASADGDIGLSPAILLAAICMLLAATILWKSATRFSPA